jgi:hypothetical protein
MDNLKHEKPFRCRPWLKFVTATPFAVGTTTMPFPMIYCRRWGTEAYYVMCHWGFMGFHMGHDSKILIGISYSFYTLFVFSKVFKITTGKKLHFVTSLISGITVLTKSSLRYTCHCKNRYWPLCHWTQFEVRMHQPADTGIVWQISQQSAHFLTEGAGRPCPSLPRPQLWSARGLFCQH